MSHRRRRGISLVESLIVISLISLVLSLSSTMLIASFRTHERAVAREDVQRSLARLALRLRTDAHAARSAHKLSEEGTGVRLSLADGRTITYEASGDEMVRTVQRDDTVVHRDAFSLPDLNTTCSVAASAEDKTGGTLVVVEFHSRSKHPTRHAAQLLPIETAVGISSFEWNTESDE